MNATQWNLAGDVTLLSHLTTKDSFGDDFLILSGNGLWGYNSLDLSEGKRGKGGSWKEDSYITSVNC
jgi:hypothetical protein